MTTEYTVSIGEILVAIDKKTDSKLDLLPEGTSGNVVVSTTTGIERSPYILDGAVEIDEIEIDEIAIVETIADAANASQNKIPTEKAVADAIEGFTGGETVTVEDVLSSTSGTSALSANMGRELAETKMDALGLGIVGNLVTSTERGVRRTSYGITGLFELDDDGDVEIVNELTEESTDDQVPTAKAVWDALAALEAKLTS